MTPDVLGYVAPRPPSPGTLLRPCRSTELVDSLRHCKLETVRSRLGRAKVHCKAHWKAHRKASWKAREKAPSRAHSKAHFKARRKACSKAPRKARFKARGKARETACFKARRKASRKARFKAQSKARFKPRSKPHLKAAPRAVSSPYPIRENCGFVPARSYMLYAVVDPCANREPVTGNSRPQGAGALGGKRLVSLEVYLGVRPNVCWIVSCAAWARASGPVSRLVS